MKKTLFVLAVLALISSPVLAYNSLETVDESRERHSSENYEYQQDHGTPLGGYPEKLGDPAPSGTTYPGYADKGDQ